ncbi:MAG: S8 family serine peptidase [Fervidobacterium sp.]
MPFRSDYTKETLDFYLWGHRAIDVKQSWDEGFEGDEIIVAVLDTGVDGTHPDLVGQVIEGYRPKSGQIIQASSDSSFGGSHGTHVAGIIAAKKDGKGIVGVAPKVKIMPIVIFDEGGWYVGDDFTAKGIIWAVDHGAKILSNSWGGPGYSQLLKDAFDYAFERNVLVVAAAGNSTSSQSFMYPANYPGVIQVGAAEYNGGDIKTANFSNRSPSLSISAPGVDILSTMPQEYSYGYDKDSFLSNDNNGYYGFMSGTSMATPYVSGLVALLLQKYPQAKPWQIKGLIEKSALDIDEPGVDEKSGYGLLQAKAVKADIPLSGGTNFFVKVTDAYESWNIPSVFITLIGTSENGRVVRYFAKTNKDGVAKFYNIPTGKYDIFLGGPDSQEKTTVSSLPNVCIRKSEERFIRLERVVESEFENILIKLKSSAILTLISKPAKIIVHFEKKKNSGEIFIEKSVDFSTIQSYDFSELSGKYRIKVSLPEKAASNLKINGEITLNGKVIAVNGTILKDSTETILSDNVSEWWTVFGNGQ